MGSAHGAALDAGTLRQALRMSFRAGLRFGAAVIGGRRDGASPSKTEARGRVAAKLLCVGAAGRGAG
jgi:hypothetical protein